MFLTFLFISSYLLSCLFDLLTLWMCDYIFLVFFTANVNHCWAMFLGFVLFFIFRLIWIFCACSFVLFALVCLRFCYVFLFSSLSLKFLYLIFLLIMLLLLRCSMFLLLPPPSLCPSTPPLPASRPSPFPHLPFPILLLLYFWQTCLCLRCLLFSSAKMSLFLGGTWCCCRSRPLWLPLVPRWCSLTGNSPRSFDSGNFWCLQRRLYTSEPVVFSLY